MIGQRAPVVDNGSARYDRASAYDAPVGYDAATLTPTDTRALADLRRELNARLGFYTPATPAGQLYPSGSAYPPGVAALLDSFLRGSNHQLFRRYPQLRANRWFAIDTVVGAALYDLPFDGADTLDPRRVVGAFVTQDGRSAWPLNYGLLPALCDEAQTGRPWCYEIREVIEVWPIPDQVYQLRFMGDAALRAFEADADLSSVDGDLLLLHALARAKSHYGQPDASVVNQDCEVLLRKLTAGAHGTQRYIPGTRPLAPLARPLIRGIDVP